MKIPSCVGNMLKCSNRLNENSIYLTSICIAYESIFVDDLF